MDNARVKFLVDRYRDGIASDEEIAELRLLVLDARYRHLLEAWTDELWDDLDKEALSDMSGERQQAALWRIIGHYNKDYGRIHRLMKYAVAVVLLVSVGAFSFWYWQESPAAIFLTVGADDVTEISPGANKAVLTLADGRKIVLDDLVGGERMEVGAATTALKHVDGVLVYQSEHEHHLSTAKQQEVYNTITTPIGGQYRVILPDGSEVMLNAGSALRYPVVFGKGKRVVEFSGEGYFKVASDQNRPFFVETMLADERHTVQVLGTEFNINTYDHEREVLTSVIEGSVGVSATHQGLGSVVLAPGQQSVLSGKSGASSLRVVMADLNSVTAWKDGLFVFNDERLPDLLKRVARWYNVTFTYEDDVNDIRFQGNYFRDKGLLNLLENLEMAAQVEFLIEKKEMANTSSERRVYVKRR
ncbi:FecR family protein [Parapedobacter deserti]|uniref:FecR family protein n=1 Tax=Parapedobacter deserti TaxID=1912957 RepID=A0ABV7JIN8_9SPHI